MSKIIVIAGATGNLGERIVKALLDKNAQVHALVRSSSDSETINRLENLGAKVFRVTHWNVGELTTACLGASCVVSALSGLREVIVVAQKVLLDAAIAAGVPRFIPSDYSLDFTKFTDGENRNLDWRREFHEYLDKTAISATTIFNGAFAELLTDQMPVIHFKQKLVVYWRNADYRWNFTTMDNTAEYTANAALDPSTPRFLRIAGDQVSPRHIQAIMREITGEKFRLLRAGGKGLLGIIISMARLAAPGKENLYPAWQGMQYMQNMVDERSRMSSLDNNRYPAIHWTSVKEVLTNHQRNSH
ncbi:NmrA family NAD(P)-binding protein [Pontibacter sp. E15-1]|uniref:NmrA family NAD(P)-binding protein n=1 Tax=Pontibacter sp. E15-1 TaxID=2919918 RepID=UPI001F4F8D1D|nr:NmrA family NAD(P)-binding protein [Pontibacter sp. E15-1]MCJ8167098.1 NmrA family NAD(P)-binding protein [Pontibacter sp. E15-1]